LWAGAPISLIPPAAVKPPAGGQGMGLKLITKDMKVSPSYPGCGETASPPPPVSPRNGGGSRGYGCEAWMPACQHGTEVTDIN